MQVQGDIGLTEKKIFSEIARKAEKYLKDEGSIPDVRLMLLLGFSPPSWKIWKSKLAEIFSINTYSKLDNDKGEIEIKIVYC